MPQQPIYGPQNPHPLSTLRTQLVWEGKYDEYGQRREVDMKVLRKISGRMILEIA